MSLNHCAPRSLGCRQWGQADKGRDRLRQGLILGQRDQVKPKRPYSVYDLLDGKVPDAEQWEPVDPLDWDFRSCPDDELDECHAYEYARHVGPILQDVARLRKGKGRSFDQLFASLRKIVFATDSVRRMASFWFYPEFPNAPYLSIPAKERDRRVKIAWGEPQAQAAAFASLLRPKMLPQNLAEDLRAGLRKHGRPCIRYGCLELSLIELNWTYSNDRLLKKFAAWLRKNRPADVEVMQEKGAGSVVRMLRTDLKSLGAWRLLKLKGKCDEAFVETFKDGRSLYGNSFKSWTRAAKRADDYIQWLETVARKPNPLE